MRAIVITRFGTPEVLQLKEVADPIPGPEQVLVRAQAGGINFADVITVRGGYPGTPPPPLVAGREFSGIREGDGQRVMGYTQWGGFAKLVAASVGLLWPVPEGWSAEEGAAFPVNYFTAYLAYWKAGLLESTAAMNKPRVLIHAAAGGVGTAAVQIGKILELETYGTSSSDQKLARAQALGLQHPINYKKADYEEAIQDMTGGEGVDVVLEMLGGEHTLKSIRCLRTLGRVIVYGNATGKPASLDPRVLYAKSASVHGLWLTYLSRNSALMEQAWKQLAEWTSRGYLRPVIGTVLPWVEAAAGYELLSNGVNFGKVVMRID